MYLHLGNSAVVHDHSVVGVFDLDITSQSLRTREFLSRAEQSGQVTAVSGEELPKSFVVCAEQGQQRVYLSQLSSQTLFKRGESGLAGEGLLRPQEESLL